MKKLFVLVVALAAVTTAFAQQEAKTFSIAPKVGLNAASMTKAANSKMRLGVVAGVEFTSQLSDRFALSAGVFYSQQGVKGSDFDEEEGFFKGTMKNDYLNIPILANVYLFKGFALKAGVQPGFLLSAKAVATTQASGQVTENTKDHFKKVDVSIPVGLSYEFSKVIIDARYNIGVTRAFKDKDDADAKNGVFMVTVGYKFTL